MKDESTNEMIEEILKGIVKEIEIENVPLKEIYRRIDVLKEEYNKSKTTIEGYIEDCDKLDKKLDKLIEKIKNVR